MSGPCCHYCIVHHPRCSGSRSSSSSPHCHHAVSLSPHCQVSHHQVSITTLCHRSVRRDVSLSLPCMTQALHGEISCSNSPAEITNYASAACETLTPSLWTRVSRILYLVSSSGKLSTFKSETILIIKYSNQAACMIDPRYVAQIKGIAYGRRQDFTTCYADDINLRLD